MAYEKTYRMVVPVALDVAEADLLVTRWLARESLEKVADRAGLVIVDYREDTLDPADLPPKAAEPLGGANADWWWLEFTGVARAQAV